MNSYKWSPPVLGAIRVDVERTAVPGYSFGLDLKTFWIAIAMTMDHNRGAYWDDPFLQAGALGSGRRSEREVPDLPIGGTDLHCGMRSGKADAGDHRARDFEFLIQIPTPTVMGRRWKSCERKSQDTKADAK